MDALETIYVIFRKTIVQRVAVVKPGVNDGGGNGHYCLTEKKSRQGRIQ